MRTVTATTLVVILVVSIALSVVATAVSLVQLGQGRSVTQTTTSTIFVFASTINGSTGVYAAFLDHLLSMESGNLSRIAAGYANNATLVLETRLPLETPILQAADINGWSGQFVGVANVSMQAIHVFAVEFQAGNNMTMAIRNYTAQIAAGGTTAVWNATLDIVGFGNGYGHTTATMSLEVKYVLAIGGTWLISSETWNTTSYTDQISIINP